MVSLRMQSSPSDGSEPAVDGGTGRLRARQCGRDLKGSLLLLQSGLSPALAGEAPTAHWLQSLWPRFPFSEDAIPSFIDISHIHKRRPGGHPWVGVALKTACQVGSQWTRGACPRTVLVGFAHVFVCRRLKRTLADCPECVSASLSCRGVRDYGHAFVTYCLTLHHQAFVNRHP